ncbi:MAG: ABC transporter permease [Nitrososphaerota archaeon]|jgi:ABC-2 type transport system permease protein|nr:ABC transporter permease [Nitrososphaerota archaeon]
MKEYEQAQLSRGSVSWFRRFMAVVRYEMLWNIRKKKFIGVIIIAFLLAALGLVVPLVLDESIPQNAHFAITYGADGLSLFLFALAIAMNSMSSEFEGGTIVPLLTKPVSRTTVFLGKVFAAFIILLVSFTVIFTFTTIGSIFVYGPQSDLGLLPAVLLGNIISAFIWISILIAMGTITKNTILTVIISLGLFITLFMALPTISVLAGPSPALNYLPGSGSSGTLTTVDNATFPISAGTDSLGVNFVYALLYSGQNVNFSKIDIWSVQTGDRILPTTELLYTESIEFVALRGSVSVNRLVSV